MTNITDTKTHQPVLQKIGWLVVWNMFYFPFHIWDVILPIDELHHFSRWLLHHQPVYVYIYIYYIWDTNDTISLPKALLSGYLTVCHGIDDP